MEIEEFDFLYLVLTGDSLSPVGIENLRDMTIFLCRSKTCVTCFFAEKADDTGTIAVEDDDADTEAEMLEILADTKEIRREVVVH